MVLNENIFEHCKSYSSFILMFVIFIFQISCGEPAEQSNEESIAAQSVEEEKVPTSQNSIVIELFDPNDLSENVRDIASKMNAFEFHLKPVGGDCAQGSEEYVRQSLLKFGKFTMKVDQSCLYEASLSYGYSEKIKAGSSDEILKLDSIYYQSKEPILLTQDYMLKHNPIDLKFLLELSEEGKKIGLIIPRIQGFQYVRGEKIKITKTVKPK